MRYQAALRPARRNLGAPPGERKARTGREEGRAPRGSRGVRQGRDAAPGPRTARPHRAREGAVGPDTRAGERMQLSFEFLQFVTREMVGITERWDAYKATRR